MQAAQIIQRTPNSDVEEAIKPELADPFTWVSRLIANRVQDVPSLSDFMRYDIQDMPDPRLMKDMEKAAGILADAIKAKRRVFVMADWDADGIGAAAIVDMALSKFGARRFDPKAPSEPFDFKVHFPDRLIENHGLNLRAVDAAAAMGAQVILTVDNGSSSAEAIAAAKAQNIQVLVSDHHEVPAGDLPADAVVNPKQADDHLGDESFCGAGIAYLLMVELKRVLGSDVDISGCLQVAAISTMADVVPLSRNNRRLVRCGVQLIRTQPIPFIKALCGILNLKVDRLEGRDLAWSIAPVLNAAGRIERASYAYHALLAGEDRADAAAEYLHGCNIKRRAMMTEAMKQKPGWAFEGERVHLFADATWHAGIVGLIAGDLSRKSGKVTGCATLDLDGNWRFSFRSPANGAGIAEAMGKMKAAGAILSGGGHDAAGGCVVAKDRLPIFSKLIDQALEDVDAMIEVDGKISPAWWTVEGLQYVNEVLEPTGNGNPPVHMLWEGTPDSAVPMKDRHIKMVIGGVDVVWFNVQNRDEALKKFQNGPVRIVYAPQINEFGGRISVQGVVIHAVEAGG